MGLAEFEESMIPGGGAFSNERKREEGLMCCQYEKDATGLKM